jgi:hypothetical protein
MGSIGVGTTVRGRQLAMFVVRCPFSIHLRLIFTIRTGFSPLMSMLSIWEAHSVFRFTYKNLLTGIDLVRGVYQARHIDLSLQDLL